MRPEETVIMVPSCWAYRDTWQPFMKLMNKFWPRRKFLTVLVTDKYQETSKHSWEGDSITSLNGDFGWCSNLARAIRFERMGGARRILYLQDDYFLSREVDTDYLDYAIQYMDSHSEVGCFRLYPCPGPDEDIPEEKNLGRVHKDAPYSVSCQAALWDPTYILKLLDRFENPWQFELAGSVYAETLGAVTVSVKREPRPWPLEYICTAIVKGQWQNGAIQHCKNNGIDLDLSLRQTEVNS